MIRGSSLSQPKSRSAKSAPSVASPASISIGRARSASPNAMLIDSVAMQRYLHGSDEYLDSWTSGEPLDRPGTAREVADAVAAEIEARFAEFAARAFTIA